MRTQRHVYPAVVLLVLALYTTVWVAAAVLYSPNMQWFSYYAVDYQLGFVRRGLAGEIVNLFPASQYFTVMLTLRWLVPALFALALLWVAWTVASRFGMTERRIMLALILPALPFGVVHAIAIPTPDLLGSTALAVYAVALTKVNNTRSTLVASAIYGFTIALLSLIHEAVGPLFALGAILAVVTLARQQSIRVQRNSALLAVVPGLLVMLVIILLGRRDVSAQCARLPHALVDWSINLPMSQILAGQREYTDYHDWVCTYVVSLFNVPATEAIRGYAQIGATALFLSTLFGVAVLAGTLLILSKVSGVPLRGFCGVLRGRLWWVVAGILLVLPVFATGSDWVRWWIAITFDVGLVYVLYASGQPESEQPATRRTRVFFAVGLIVLLLVPTGTVSHVGVVEHAHATGHKIG